MNDRPSTDASDILNFLQESVIVRSLDGRIEGWNAASERIYGWQATDVTGRHVQELLQTAGEPLPDRGAALHQIDGWRGEVIRRTAAGRTIAVDVTWHIRRNPDGQPRDIVETGLPVTPARLVDDVLAEHRYRTLFQFIPVALIQFDRTTLAEVFADLKAQGVQDLAIHIDAHPEFMRFAMDSIRIVEVNRKAVELFGADDPAQLLGPATQFWSESPEVFYQSMISRYRAGLKFEGEMQIRTFDSRILHALYVTHFPEALQLEALGLACLVNIEDRVQAQGKLLQVQAEFAHAARVSMLGELTASIAHEVSQPLGAILTSAEAALRWLDREEPDIKELRALSQRTVLDAGRAADIIQRIRSMAARTGPEQALTSWNNVVEEVVAFLRPELRRHQVEVMLDLGPDLPPVMGDRVQLQQVLANLAINAMQAMATSNTPGRMLTIRTAYIEADKLSTEVEDTGPGITTQYLDRIFDSFFTTKDHGLGIGLAICQTIIEAHGGTISAANRSSGTGARFRFTLPVLRSE
jgi:PAS domain S-box-containing protein